MSVKNLDLLVGNDKIEKGRAFIYLSFFIFIITAFFSKGYHHFDEHFQILELANYKLGHTPTDNLPWEYWQKMRPAVQPIMVYVLYKLMAFIGVPNPFVLSTILRLLSAVFTFLVVKSLFGLFAGKAENKVALKWYFFFSFFLWYQYYTGVRFSSENWSANFFLASFVVYHNSFLTKKAIKYVIVGALIGAAFMFRFQTAFLSAGFIAWMILVDKQKVNNLLLILLGALSFVSIGVAMDSMFYGEFTLSFWNYFMQFFAENKVCTFEAHPLWYYPWQFFVRGIPPLSLLLLFSLIYFIYRNIKHSISWILIPFLLAHFLVPHKEVRFLYAIICFLPITFLYLLKDLEGMNNWLQNRFFKLTLKLSVVANVLFLLVVAFRPADAQIPLYKSIYHSYKEPTVLYHLGNNPYHRIQEIYFYKRSNLEIREIESLEEINTSDQRTKLLVVNQKEELTAEFLQENPMVYCTFPKRVAAIQFNNWQKRTKSWRVFELN